MCDLTIDEYKEKKAAMERKMRSSLAEIVADFKRDTGMTPNYITVQMTNKTAMGDSRSQFTVGAVETDIDV